jgi:hypothetical protein
MSAIELLSTGLAVVFFAVALYSAARFAWSFSSKETQAARRVLPGEKLPDITHALMALAMGIMLFPQVNVIPPAFGILVFLFLAAGFVITLRRYGMTSYVGTDWDGHRSKHGGYNLHHLVACVAMAYMFAAGYSGMEGASTAADAFGPPITTSAAAHHSVASLTSVSWMFGLYFLVAATSLGFRVAEPTVKVTHYAAVPAGIGPWAAPAPKPVPVRFFWSPAGLCATEVMMSGGMAFMFFRML